MIDQLMREKVRDLSFINLEFHFERLIISEYSKFLKFLKIFQSENSNYPGSSLIDQKWRFDQQATPQRPSFLVPFLSETYEIENSKFRKGGWQIETLWW